MAIPNQDKLVYEALSEYGREEKVEVLLPPPEEPLPAPTSAVPRPVAPEQPAAQPAEAEAPPATPETPETPEPTTEIATAEPEPEATPPSPEPPAKAATAASPKPAEAATVAAVPPAAASPAPTAAAKTFMVQLGAYRKAPAADTGWRRLLKANRDLLGDLKPKVVRADLGADKGVFFRLRAGPLGDEAAAKALCARLKARRQDCFIVRP
jgi:cell division protein FtsN